MAIKDLFEKRFSVRGYRDTPVPEDALLKVLEAGRNAPSACNNQPWFFIVVRSLPARKKLGTAYPRDWLIGAPIIIAVCADRNTAWVRKDGRNYADVDAAIAMDHMVLQATELGLGTCWIGAFDVEKARAALEVPDTVEPLLLTPLGYPNMPQPLRTRKPFNEVVFWDTFGNRRT
jgi:nitroreductase